MIIRKMWVLYHDKGEKISVVAIFRFKPKRRKCGPKEQRYWAWHDCNGKGPIEGTMNAKLKQMDLVLPLTE